jgi:acyl CoA:acetate/3-ketoacid CoA transferase
MEDTCVLKFAVHDTAGSVNIFSAVFPRWNLPGVGDHILVNNRDAQVVFTVTGKTHVFENGMFKELLYAVSQFESPE